ncbi:MAG TPA: tRNA uracil 4-sulfurtransferase ThiI [Vicinamibacterales bacterium]|jgi:thiamine biosynthesis protein ThiI
MNAVVVHYKELSLKGRNRPWFIELLVRNIRTALKGLPVKSVRSTVGRIEVELNADVPAAAGANSGAVQLRQAFVDRLGCVFGVANFSFANRSTHDFDQIARAVLDDLKGIEAASFRVSVTRSDKRLPFTSPMAEREIGGLVKQATGWRVDLEEPALTIHVEMTTAGSFYFFGKVPGAGGLPTGTGGRVACLLSGGIDSPVAAYRLMRRGCSVLLVHFHSYPILSRASQEKVREIVALLTKHQQRSRLVLVPFGELQQRVVLGVRPELRVVIYRRLMMRIAEELARRWRARALVTGEVIGQVASQTLENMATISAATQLPVLRPLVGMDKDEITNEAIRIGTYPISIIPDQDCCTLFTPRHPATRARLDDIVSAESGLSMDEMVKGAVEGSVVEDFKFPVLE